MVIAILRLRIAYRFPIFQKRAKRKTQAHPKFYFFDAGLFKALRPLGPLEADEDTLGPSLETLVLQELTALSSYLRKRYQIYYWRSAKNLEVDFVLYGEKAFFAIEVTKANRLRKEDLAGLKGFLGDYPKATAFLLYGGTDRYIEDGSISFRSTIFSARQFDYSLAPHKVSQLLFSRPSLRASSGRLFKCRIRQPQTCEIAPSALES